MNPMSPKLDSFPEMRPMSPKLESFSEMSPMSPKLESFTEMSPFVRLISVNECKDVTEATQIRK